MNYVPSVGDIVRATPPRQRARLARITQVIIGDDDRPEAVTISNRTLLGGGVHPQVMCSRVLYVSDVAPASLRERTLVEKWEESVAAVSLRASLKSPPRRRGGR